MAIDTLINRNWRRFHDPENFSIKTGATVHCTDDLADLIRLCRDRAEEVRFTAVGSHWALSTAAVSDDQFIESNWPASDTVRRNRGFATDMYKLINPDVFEFMVDNPPRRPHELKSDPCLPSEDRSVFFVHLKAGTRIYQAYSMLDRSPVLMTNLAKQLNLRLLGSSHPNAYDGPWGFSTLGGAGGQTVFGALTTGTHGGDYLQKPISDAVMALHLVTDGGAHYWIEPSTTAMELPLTSDEQLYSAYQNAVSGVPFEIIRDNDVFQSVVVGAGRFGAVHSFVLRVVPQYCLHEHRRLDRWSSVKSVLLSTNRHRSFDSVHFAGNIAFQAEDRRKFTERFGNPLDFQSRFLQIAVNLCPGKDGQEHLCGVTQRWFYPPSRRNEGVDSEMIDPATGDIRGRWERGTVEAAGRDDAYTPPDDLTKAGGNGTFISRACTNGNFVAGVLREAADKIDEIVQNGAVPATSVAVAALGIGLGAAVLAIAGVCAILALAALAFRELADEAEQAGDVSFATIIDAGVRAIMDNRAIPTPLGVMIIRCIFHDVFESQQKDRDYVAISYAVMDIHDYLDRSCFGDVLAVEVFFDARRPDLYCAYMDEILSFEAFQQEQHGRFTIGYVSMRYLLGSDALLAPARFPETVVMEIAALRKAAGSKDFVMNAAKVARKRIYNASFHWGQWNPLEREEVERHFGESPGSRLGRWRASLRRLTEDGQRDGFSNDFTRRTGLEPL